MSRTEPERKWRGEREALTAEKRPPNKLRGSFHQEFTASSSAFHAAGADWRPMSKKAKAFSFVAVGVAVCAAGIYVGENDDAPGAALLGILLLISTVVYAVKIVRRQA